MTLREELCTLFLINKENVNQVYGLQSESHPQSVEIRAIKQPQSYRKEDPNHTFGWLHNFLRAVM